MRRSVHLTLLLAAALSLLAVPIASGASPDLVVSQVYAGGGNSGATYANDFVELFNRGSATVDLSGWSLQYATAAGTSWQVTALAGSLAPGHHYLVALASGGTNGAALPDGRRDAAPRTSRPPAARWRWCTTPPRSPVERRPAAAARSRSSATSSGTDRQPTSKAQPRRRSRAPTAAIRARTAATTPTRTAPTSRPTRRLPEHVDGGDDLHRNAAAGRLRLGHGERRARPAVDALDRAREADAELRQRLTRRLARGAHRPHHRHEHERRRLHAQRAPKRVRAGRSSARPLRHGSRRAGSSGRRSPAAPGPRSPIAPAADLARRHDGGTERRRPATDWPTSLAFTSPLPTLASGHYSATVTFTVIAR